MYPNVHHSTVNNSQDMEATTSVATVYGRGTNPGSRRAETIKGQRKGRRDIRKCLVKQPATTSTSWLFNPIEVHLGTFTLPASGLFKFRCHVDPEASCATEKLWLGGPSCRYKAMFFETCLQEPLGTRNSFPGSASVWSTHKMAGPGLQEQPSCSQGDNGSWCRSATFSLVR